MWGIALPTPDYIAQALQWCEKHGFLKLLHNFAAYLNSDSTLNVALISREIIMDYNTSLSSVDRIPSPEIVSQEMDPRILARSYLMFKIGISIKLLCLF